MIEVRARCTCCTPECDETIEYWATLDTVEKNYSDSYKSQTRTEISISMPREGWTDEGNWTLRMYCPECSLNRRKERQRRQP